MARVIFAALGGAIIYYIWQMAAWMFIPLHGPTVHQLPNEDAVRETLTAQDLKTGLYSLPYGTDEEMMEPESEFGKRHKAGPIVSIIYSREGSDPMPPSIMAIGFATDFAAAFIVSLLLSCTGPCCNSYLRRVGFVTAFGIFLALTAHVAFYNWMRFPMDFALAFVVDAVVGWFLAGLVIAAIVRPSPFAGIAAA